MIYLDSAATTLQKPPQVSRAVAYAINNYASAGRGGHAPAMKAADVMLECREAAAALFNVDNPENITFTQNATHGLNIAIKSLVKPGGRAVISGFEHNAVVRPLHAIGAEIAVAGDVLFDEEKCVKDFERELSRGVDAAVINHVSNVFGYIQPVERVAELCRFYKVPLVIDASQSAGTIGINFSELGATFMAMPGHKGLYGPQGTGLLLCAGQVKPIMEGGTGSRSLDRDMPEELPDRLEAGTQNACGIAGLLEGIRFVINRGAENIGKYEKMLVELMAVNLRKIDNIKCYFANDKRLQGGVLSFVAENMECETVGRLLGQRGAAVRSGLHCAPLAHESAGTVDTGTVRISVSAFNKQEEIIRFVSVLKDVLKRGNS